MLLTEEDGGIMLEAGVVVNEILSEIRVIAKRQQEMVENEKDTETNKNSG